MTIELNEIEQTLAKLIGKKRYKTNRESSITNNRIGKQSDEATDLNGIGAEIAFCKYANLYPDYSLFPRKGGADCIDRKGNKIDVKTTTYKTGHLIAVGTTTKGNVNFYVLMVGDMPTYEYKGWCTEDDLLKEENLRDFGYGKPSYALPQESLNLAHN
jgi:hypothetical protein